MMQRPVGQSVTQAGSLTVMTLQVWIALAAAHCLGAMSPGPSLALILRNTIALLVYLGFVIIRHAMTGPYSFADGNELKETAGTGFMQGFSLAIFNPKILAWMLAIYAPFLNQNLDALTIAAMVIMGMVIDGGWYVLVALVLSRGAWINRIRAHAHRIDLAMGVLMFLFAGFLLFGA